MTQAFRQSIQAQAGLPAQFTLFVGRRRELAEIVALLQQADIRLLTLTGSGGSGKTRLALQAAMAASEHFGDGCWFVDLAPLTDARQIPAAIAGALGIHIAATDAPDNDIIAFLRPRTALLVLDNFEHVLSAGALVGKILVAAPGVTILATSRVALQVYGEVDLPLAPLKLPDPQVNDTDELLNADAVQLFLARASAHPDPDWARRHAATIAAICRRLDGLPLAIELAAARVKAFPPDALLQRLLSFGALPVLSSGPRNAPLRQQTIRGTIAWSYDLLSVAEQTLFARLGVFVGWFSASAAATICADDSAGMSSIAAEDALAVLVEQSLIQIADGVDGEIRYSLLETIREYALERLRERADEARLRRRHAEHYAAEVEALSAGRAAFDQPAWLARLDLAYPNIAAALEYTLRDSASPGDLAELGLRLVAALWPYWRARGLFGDAYRWLEAPAMYDQTLPPVLRARALVGIAWVADRQQLSERSSLLANVALTLARQTGDRLAILQALVLAAEDDRDRTAATALRRECLALADELDDPWLRYQTLQRFHHPAFDADPADWQQFWDELEQLAAASNDLWLWSDMLCMRFYYALRHNDRITASRMAASHDTVARRLGSRQALALSAECHAALAAAEGDLDAALTHQRARLAFERALGNRSGIGYALLEIAFINHDWADFAASEAALSEAIANLAETDDRLGESRAHQLRGWNEMWLGQYAAAERYCEQAQSSLRRSGRRELREWAIDEVFFLRGLLALIQGSFDRAEAFFQEGLAFLQQTQRAFPGVGLNHRAGLGMTASRRGQHDASLAILDPAVAELRTLQDLRLIMIAQWILAPALLAAGRHTEAARRFAEGLELARQRGSRVWSMQLLDGAARCMAERGDPADAVRCWSAVERFRQHAGMPRWPIEQNDYRQHLDAARAALGETGFAAAWDAGQCLNWETTVDTAITLLRSPALPVVSVAVDDDTRRELVTAAAIQAGLLPATLPQPPGWRLAASLVPARETAGDFYDCFTLPDGRIALVIADVAGKGLGAALYMATGRALIRTLCGMNRIEPADVMAGVNTHLLGDTRADLFITAFYGILNPRDGTLQYANAGHPPPLLLRRADRELETLMPTGLVLGVEPGVTWRQQQTRLEPGDLLLLYTDGVTEAQDAAGDFFDNERLAAVLHSHHDADAATIVALVADAVRLFAGSAPQSDDITLMALAAG